MTAEGHCNIVWGGDFKDTLRFQTSNFSFSFDATFRFADYTSTFSSKISISARFSTTKATLAPRVRTFCATVSSKSVTKVSKYAVSPPTARGMMN